VSDRFMTVAKVGEIPEGGVKVVRVDDEPVAVFHVGGQYYALADRCTHDGGELSDGDLDGHVVECARHGARFDIRTGAVLAMPATGAVPRHAVRVIGDQIQVACETCDEREAAAAAAVKPVGSAPPAVPSPSATLPPGTGSPGGQPSVRRGLEPPATAESGTAAAAASAQGTPAPSLQEFAVRAALETVMDPEIQLSVVDLGLIREIVIEPGRTTVRMLLTTPFCPYAPQLTQDVRQAAMSVVDQPCEVEILPDAWSPEMMPDPGLLGFST
jgi:nitrite reductase/ring-hydroxylating ferredoxin subunit/metal-sulfur cluster biosynthetic enzyme